MTTVKNLVICADDFGFSRSVNAAILDAAEFGTLTAASVMVNMPFAELACAEAQECGANLSLGLHFTLTSGKPLSDPKEIPLLVNAQGHFRLGFGGLWKLLRSNEFRRDALLQIRTEFFAQMNKMDRLMSHNNQRFDHLNSHQHIHVLPGVFELLHEESVKRSLTLRVPREDFGDVSRFLRRFYKWFPQGMCKQFILNYYSRGKEQDIGYYGILETGKIDENAMINIVRSISGIRSRFSTFELNIHPGRIISTYQHHEESNAGMADCIFHQSAWRELEFKTLKSQKVVDAIKRYGIRLTDFQR